MIILAIDPALRSTGIAVLKAEENDMSALYHSVIKNQQSVSHAKCLLNIHNEVSDVISKFKPDVCAVEGVIYVQSHRIAITMGAARGSAILAAAEAGLEVFEYAPKKVKQAVVGKGSAKKDQVAFMVRALLKLEETPPSDAADALAIAMAHVQSAKQSSMIK